MLVISRKAEEFLQIGEDIVIKVIKCSSGSVKIGIDAPGDLRVLRGELQELPKSFPKPLAKRGLTLRTETKEAEAMAEVL
jgi:carbon storage regulator